MRPMSHVMIFLGLRVVHVLFAALWLGSAAFITWFLMPAIQQAGPSAATMMGVLERRKLSAFMGAVGGLTVLTGFALYWRLTGHFDPALSATRTAMVFGTGGVIGLIALILGGAVVGRNAKKMAALGESLSAMPDGPGRASTMAAMTAAGQRVATVGRVVVFLLMLALALMAVGHYV